MIYSRKCFNPDSLEATRAHVTMHISACCAFDDSPSMYALDVKLTETPQEDGSVLVTGSLPGHEPWAEYLDAAYGEPETNQLSKVHEPVDYTPAQLQAHLIEKAKR